MCVGEIHKLFFFLPVNEYIKVAKEQYGYTLDQVS